MRGYRIANEGKFSLPIGHFRTTLTVTLTDPMTGETVTKDNVRPEDMEHARRELALSLTAKVYAHTQAAEILDTLEAHKLAVQESAPTSVSLIVGPQSYALETVHYDNINTDTVDIHAMPEMP